MQVHLSAPPPPCSSPPAHPAPVQHQYRRAEVGSSIGQPPHPLLPLASHPRTVEHRHHRCILQWPSRDPGRAQTFLNTAPDNSFTNEREVSRFNIGQSLSMLQRCLDRGWPIKGRPLLKSSDNAVASHVPQFRPPRSATQKSRRYSSA